MPQVRLDEQVFETAQRRAVDAGYSSVEEYISDFVVHDQVDDMASQTPDLEHLFTPDRLAHIDAAMAEIKGGRSFSSEEAADELANRRQEWLRKNPA
jgi:hypothetical protein